VHLLIFCNYTLVTTIFMTVTRPPRNSLRLGENRGSRAKKHGENSPKQQARQENGVSSPIADARFCLPLMHESDFNKL
jgi:hypothetical protein